MSDNRCPQCGAPIDPGAIECKFCGERLAGAQVVQQMQQQVYAQQPYAQPQQPYAQQPYAQPQQPVYQTAINPAWPIKNKIAAGLLAIFFGGIGVHKFYMGQIGMGIIYLLFCWTGIPAFIGWIEGIIYLCSNDENFMLKYHVRLQ
ncbi:MAG: NINE protein [Lachnospiraceae bacterium]|nr:NINE protein [Candidatus Colinaster scatohippi]